MKKLAILIGVDRYDSLPSLEFAVADAVGVADSLKTNYGFSDSEIQLLTTGGVEPTRDAIESRLNALRDSKDDLGLLIFGFWGHGFRLADGSRYLCPPKAEDVALAKTGISVDDVLTKIGQIGAASTAAILDCCQNVPATRGGAATDFSEAEAASTSRSVAKASRDVWATRKKNGWETARSTPTVAILNSCSPGEKAFEWREKEHGVFTSFLLEAMEERYPKFGEWAEYVEENVARADKLTNGKQRPFFKIEGGANVWIGPKGKAVPRGPVVGGERGAGSAPKKGFWRRLVDAFLAPEHPAAPVVEPEPIPVYTPIATWTDGTRAGERRELEIAGVKFGLCWAPPGTFPMGSPESEEGRYDDERLHTVTLTRGFWIGETQVTQALWTVVMGKNPSGFKGDDEAPVERVSWDDCQNFLAKLNASGRAPSGTRFRLPTEAEWEYACRAGTTTPFWWGGSLNGDRANCNGRFPYGTRAEGAYFAKTRAAKSYSPNPWGLYDVHGNVCEWCADWYDNNFYANGPNVDPTGPTSASDRVVRGGGWYGLAENCRSAFRDYGLPSSRSNYVGLRLVLSSSK